MVIGAAFGDNAAPRAVTGSRPDAPTQGTWSTWREAAAVVLTRVNLRATMTVAAVVGTILLVINHLDAVLEGRIDIGLLLKVVLTYIVPFLVCNYGVLTATHRRRAKPR